MRKYTWATAAALACLGGIAVTASAATPPKPSLAAYQACLKKHGVTFGAGGTQPSQTKTQAAFRACRSLSPNGAGNQPQASAAQRAAFQKYAACLKKHGVTLPSGNPSQGGPPAGRPLNSNPGANGQPAFQRSAKFKAADKACAKLRPARFTR